MAITSNIRAICLFIIFLFYNFLFARCIRDTTIIENKTVVICSTYAKAGYLRSVYTEENGKLHGIYKSWHKNGRLKSIAKYNEGKSIDTSFSYYKSGKLESIGLKNGKWFRLFENGDTAVVGNNKNGKAVAIRRTYFLNGNLKTRYNYNSGKKHGLSETWFENGARKDSIVYENGVSFLARYYYNSGKIRYREKYSGNFTIEGVYYDPKGKVCSKIIGGNGTKIIYTIDASNCYTYKYKNGKRVN